MFFFFMFGINSGRKDFDFSQSVLCRVCGRYGRYQVYMTYMQFIFFFIPMFKWNKAYYVETSCCGTVYRLDLEVGKRIERGETVEIQDRDLTPLGGGYRSTWKHCPNCGFTTDEDFDFCPKCGTRLEY